MTSNIGGANLGQIAAAIAYRDLKRIDISIRSGLTKGLDSVALARQVLGSASKNGTDGATELTRHDIATIGFAAIKGLNHRMRGNKP